MMPIAYSLLLPLILSPHYSQAFFGHKGSPIDEAVDKISADLASSVPPDSRLLVTDLTDLDDRTSYFGRFLADKIQVTLSKGRPGFSLIDRRRIDLSLQEVTFQKTGMIDENSAVALGKSLGANLLAFGTVTDVGDYIDVSIKLRQIESGKIVGGSSHQIEKNQTVAALVRDVLRSEQEKEAAIVRHRQESTGAPGKGLGLGRESEFDLGKIDRDGSSSGGFHVTNLPAVPTAEAPKELRRATSELSLGSVDVDTLEKYEEAVKFDKGEAAPKEKAESWRHLAKAEPQFASVAEKRAQDWERFAVEEKVANAALDKRVKARDADWKTLGRLLNLDVISETDKVRWTAEFLTEYGKSAGIESSMFKVFKAHVATSTWRTWPPVAPEENESAGAPHETKWTPGTPNKFIPPQPGELGATDDKLALLQEHVKKAQAKFDAAAHSWLATQSDVDDFRFEVEKAEQAYRWALQSAELAQKWTALGAQNEKWARNDRAIAKALKDAELVRKELGRDETDDEREYRLAIANGLFLLPIHKKESRP